MNNTLRRTLVGIDIGLLFVVLLLGQVMRHTQTLDTLWWISLGLCGLGFLWLTEPS